MAIVCGTDLSQPARAAVRTAAALARVVREPLWLVHVLDGPTEALGAGLMTSLLPAVERRLEQEARRVRRGRLVVRTKVLLGRAPESLVSFAEAEKASLVVVSSRGHGDSPLFRTGGTSERLVAAATVPTLVVRTARPFESWAARRPLRVFLGVDFTAASDAPIRWVKALRRAGPCAVVVAHVYYPDDVARQYGEEGVPPMGPVGPALEVLVARDIEDRCGPWPGRIKPVFRPVRGFGRLADHLLEAAESARTDLLVVGTRPHHGVRRLWSVSSGALHMSRMSVAAIPTGEDANVPSTEPVTPRRVLVAVDFDEGAAPALAHAYGLLRAGGEVHLLHVVEGRRRPAEGAVAARLRALAATLSRRGQRVATRFEVARGAVARTIVEVADRIGADVICMASRARGRAGAAVLGSVAQAVVRESRRSVLLVRPLPPR